MYGVCVIIGLSEYLVIFSIHAMVCFMPYTVLLNLLMFDMPMLSLEEFVSSVCRNSMGVQTEAFIGKS